MITKIAVVTGGSRGLGRDMAISIAKKNIDVILTYNSNKESAEEVVVEIERSGQKAYAIKFDVSFGTQLHESDYIQNGIPINSIS